MAEKRGLALFCAFIVGWTLIRTACRHPADPMLDTNQPASVPTFIAKNTKDTWVKFTAKIEIDDGAKTLGHSAHGGFVAARIRHENFSFRPW